MKRNGHRLNLVAPRFTCKTYLLLISDRHFILLGTVNLRKLYKDYDEQNFNNDKIPYGLILIKPARI